MMLSRRNIIISSICWMGAASTPYAQIRLASGIIRLRQNDLETFRDANNPRSIVLPSGIFECEGLQLESSTSLIGAGQGRTILRLIAGTDRPVLANADPAMGNYGIDIRELSIDGNASQQTLSTNGVEMDKVSDSRFDIEVTNCFGTGFLLSAGRNNRFGPAMFCHANGKRGAGYGLYIFGSSDNIVQGGRYDDNCIGIAVEASRIGGRARNNRVIDAQCFGNRADFNQSGAGIHFEQSEGGVCDGIIVNPTCSGSTGVGINNTACQLRIEGGQCRDNREAGIVTVSALGIDYDRVSCERNALGPSNGYRCEMRFDDSGVPVGTKGRVANCRLRGTALDGGMKSMSSRSAIDFIGNNVVGYRFPYNLQGRADRIS